MKNEINKINDDVKKGDISKEDANKKIKSLIDDPKYYQIKIKKQITEQEREALKNNPPYLKLDPNSPDFKTLKLDADRSSIDKVAPGITSNSNSVSPNTVYNYWYTTLTNIYADNAGGWGVGYYKCTKTVSSKELRIGCRAEALGSYYSQGYFERVFTAPHSGNCVIRGDIDWTGGCFYPDDCYIKMILYKYVPGTGWIELGNNNIVSLAGIRGTNGPYNAYTTVNTYLTSGATYSCLIGVITQASADASASVADSD